MGSIGPWQVILILLVIVLLFGAKKLPQIGKGMGEALRNFKKSVNDIDDATDITPIASKKSEDVSKTETRSEEKKDA
ncbi:MAG: twin-arginine translocase TatA/TatE family subunit [Mucispirillum sp.]|uniref:Sec-independent protein translocase protein TatA n=1 Tax=Candidatus Mucispirillum faecigallinarum TaxID=2838699 RepID=A0A9D2KCR0_9BACT|nr:twin-arginine translocase TatA/TatE family subunit [Mucispirillum sp.]HIZ90037.1 twin-arginine translocase TatA/TatE family subunit [Candidatus Mucispirillum faecigallinarum]